MAEYQGTVELIGGLTPKNNGTFPLASAKDIQVDDTGKRLNEKLAELEQGGDTVTVTVDGAAGTASHSSTEIYALVQAGNTVVAVLPDYANHTYQYDKYNEPTAANAMRSTVEFIRTAVDENGIVTTDYIIIHDDKSADAGYYEGTGGGSGTNGITPHIGENGNWYIGTEDTGVKAAGEDGVGITSVDEMGGDATRTTHRMNFSDGSYYEFDVYHGDKGDPYTLTETDKAVIVSAATESMKSEGSGVVLYTPQTLTAAQQEQARANLGIVGEEQYEFVDSVDDIPADADTSKKYVIDGYIYTYQEKTVNIIHNANDGTGYLNNTPQGTWGDTQYARTGGWTSPLISIDPTKLAPVGNATATAVTISGIEKVVPFYNNFPVVVYYYKSDGSQMFLKSSTDLGSIGTAGEIPTPFTFYLKDTNIFADSNWAQVYGVRISLGISSTSITADDVKNLSVNMPFFDEVGTVTGWHSTGQEFNGDKATQQNTADIETLKNDVKTLQDALANDSISVNTGEVLYAVGDSITYGTNVGGNANAWPTHLMAINGYDTTNSKNLGISGIGFCTTASGKTVRGVVDGQSFAGADIVTVAIGINDWKNSSATVENFFTEMYYCLNKIRGDNPYCRIYYILPFNFKVGTFNTFYALGFKGEGDTALCYGNTLQQFVNLIKAKF